MLEAIASAFGRTISDNTRSLITKDEREICDVIILHPAGISVIEIKSNENQVPKAKSQLNKAFDIINILLKVIGIDLDNKVFISRVIALPNPLSEKTENGKEKFLQRITNYSLLQGVQYDKEKIEEKLLLRPAKDDSISHILTQVNLDNLSVALTMLKQGKLINFDKKIPKNLLRKQMLEGEAMEKTLQKLSKQNEVQSACKSKKNESQSKRFLWLDQRQAEVMQSSCKKQYIFGPASTGKTLLIQLKVLEILNACKQDKDNRENKVLIVLPYDHLVISYKKFFQDSGFETNNSDFLITTLSGPWRTIGDAHIFIDEYCALGPKENLFAKNHQELKFKVERMSENLYCWITLDFWQGFETISEMSNYITLKDPKVTVLTMFHRCTIGVLKEYINNYNETIMEAGHQHVGQSSETVKYHLVKGEDSLNIWVRTVKETVAEQNKMGWTNDQIAIILVRPSIADSNYNIVKLKNRLEAELLNPKFDFETLSQEWPVVLICLPNNKKEDLSIAQSRAIAKIIYVQPVSDIIDDNPCIILTNNRVSHLSLTTAYLTTMMEFFAYHQEIHRNHKLMEEMTCKAFVEANKQKISLAMEQSSFHLGESFRWIFNGLLITVS